METERTHRRDASPERNGTDAVALRAALEAMRADPGRAALRFRARSSWIAGAHDRTTAGDPAPLPGGGAGSDPSEVLLQALAASLTDSLVRAAAASGVRLAEVESIAEGDLDLLGALGEGSGVARSGYRDIRVSVRVRGDAAPGALRGLVARGRRGAAVLDVVANGVPVSVDVTAD